MMNKSHEYISCLICGKADATKSNSHLVPSFLVSMYDSYDNSGDRGKDLQFTFTNVGRTVYVGSIPDTKYEELFDEQSLEDEERIKELMNNPDATDYVFCPSCEKLLADTLEAPYAISIKNKKNIDGSIAYFFWLSVIWRMDACHKDFGFRLNEDISKSLNSLLALYFDNNGQINDFNKPLSDIFNYKLLYCPDFCKRIHRGFQYCYYKNGVLTFIISDFILVAYFGGLDDLPDDYMFDSLRSSIEQAKVNDGRNDIEQKLEIATDVMDAAIRTYIQFAAKAKIDHYALLITALWEKLKIPLPLSEQILREIICEVFSDKVKIAERESIHTIAIGIQTVLRRKGIIIRK